MQLQANVLQSQQGMEAALTKAESPERMKPVSPQSMNTDLMDVDRWTWSSELDG